MGLAVSGRVLPFRRPDGTAHELSDEALVGACAQADSAALGALFERHHRRVYAFLCRVSLSRGADAEDLLQDTFAAAWRSAGRYQGNAPALSWLFGIAANVARNHARSKRRGARALAVLIDIPEATGERTDDVVARRQAMRRVEAALAELPHDHRVAFVMCELEGVAGTDAAEILGVRPGTVWRWLHLARKSLRETLEATR